MPCKQQLGILTLGLLGSQLLDLLEILLVGLGCALDDDRLSSARADDLFILHPQMVAATPEGGLRSRPLVRSSRRSP